MILAAEKAQQKAKMTAGPKVEPESHRWEVCALIITP